jgi:hypothetical protein
VLNTNSEPRTGIGVHRVRVAGEWIHVQKEIN